MDKQLNNQKVVLRTERLSTGYCNKRQHLILEKELSISIAEGELVCLLGPNGCGKSTLMRTISGLQPPITGDSFIAEVNVKDLRPHEMAKHLSFVLTDKITGSGLTVHDIVSIGRYPHQDHFARLSKQDERIIAASISDVGLEQYTHRYFDELSDGEKQRVLIAKALAQDTPLIILDEPTAHLDLPSRIEVMNILKRLAKQTKKAILLSTHELDLALQTADIIWLMARERELHRGTPEDLVLTGAFERVFHGKAFDFDKATGSFKVKHKSQGDIQLQGEGIQYNWTKRALEREGYNVVNNMEHDLKVKCTSDQWVTYNNMKSNKNYSIEEMLNDLRRTNEFTKQTISD